METNNEVKMIESQNYKILQSLLQGDKLTSIDILKMFNSFRASARIYDLKRKGWNIISKRITVPSGKHVSEYSLEKYDIPC